MTVTEMIDVLDAAKHVRHQVAALEARAILPAGNLVVGGAVDVVEDRARQPPPRELAEVVEIVAVLQTHVVPPAPFNP